MNRVHTNAGPGPVERLRARAGKRGATRRAPHGQTVPSSSRTPRAHTALPAPCRDCCASRLRHLCAATPPPLPLPLPLPLPRPLPPPLSLSRSRATASAPPTARPRTSASATAPSPYVALACLIAGRCALSSLSPRGPFLTPSPLCPLRPLCFLCSICACCRRGARSCSDCA